MKKINGIDKATKFFKRVLVFLIEYYWITLALFLVFFFRDTVILLIFIGIAGVPQLYKRVLPFPIGLELITFFTVIITFWISPFVAWVCSIPMVILSFFVFGGGRTFPKYTFLKYLYICTMAYVLMSVGMGIVNVGRLSALFVNIIGIISAFFVTGAASMKTLPAKVLNVVWNFYFFGHFAEKLLLLLP